jgi:hypothetical protein
VEWLCRNSCNGNGNGNCVGRGCNGCKRKQHGYCNGKGKCFVNGNSNRELLVCRAGCKAFAVAVSVPFPGFNPPHPCPTLLPLLLQWAVEAPSAVSGSAAWPHGSKSPLPF